jgi:3-oxoacyl-[acyl-carrier protein] reductase
MPTDISDGSGVRDRVAIVTGGNGGIGSAIVRAFCRDGARTTSADLAAEPAEHPGEGEKASYAQLDVTDIGQVKAAVDAIVAREGRIDIAVGAAGVAAGKSLEEMGVEEFHHIIDVNLLGFLNLMEAVIPHMQRQRTGKIVALGSVAARIGGVKAGAHYVAAKSGVHGAVKWAAKTYGPDGIFVNAVAPGVVLTQMWLGLNDGKPNENANGYPLGRLGRPEDIAEPVVFLSSPASNWITGTTLDINGGMYMS